MKRVLYCCNSCSPNSQLGVAGGVVLELPVHLEVVAASEAGYLDGESSRRFQRQTSTSWITLSRAAPVPKSGTSATSRAGRYRDSPVVRQRSGEESVEGGGKKQGSQWCWRRHLWRRGALRKSPSVAGAGAHDLLDLAGEFGHLRE